MNTTSATILGLTYLNFAVLVCLLCLLVGIVVWITFLLNPRRKVRGRLRVLRSQGGDDTSLIVDKKALERAKTGYYSDARLYDRPKAQGE